MMEMEAIEVGNSRSSALVAQASLRHLQLHLLLRPHPLLTNFSDLRPCRLALMLRRFGYEHFRAAAPRHTTLFRSSHHRPVCSARAAASHPADLKNSQSA